MSATDTPSPRSTLATVDDETIHVEALTDPKDGPLVRVEVEGPDEGLRAAYLTPGQARALAAALHVAAYRATTAARGED